MGASKLGAQNQPRGRRTMSDSKHAIQMSAPTAPAKAMHPLVQSAMSMGAAPDTATLRELMQLQREWEAGEAKRAYTEAMVRLKLDLPAVLERDKKVDFPTAKGRTTYTHTTLAAAIDAIHGPLSQHGFSHSWVPSSDGREVTVTCVLTHRDGHSESTTIKAPPDNSGSKGPAQAIASTITLLQRYTLLALLGIATRDMAEPEGEVSSEVSGKIDVQANQRAIAQMSRRGKTREDLEAFLGKPWQQWDEGDLDRLREMRDKQ